MDLKNCKEWKLNKNINPETKRKIKNNGPVYKKYEKLCNNDDIKNYCDKWILNKNINPETKRKIKNNGPVYKKYEKLCNEKKVKIISPLLSLSSNSSIINSSLSYSVISSKNKSLKNQIINIIKIIRKKNLLIINKFLYNTFNFDNDNNCLTIKHNKTYINNQLQLKNIIGIGGYGIAYLMKYENQFDKELNNKIINYVIKLTIMRKNENLHEIRILEYLTKYAIDYEFPHFPLTYDILSCNRNNFNKLFEIEMEDINYDIFEKLEKNKGDVLFIINEYANGGDLKTYNREINNKYTYDNVKIKFYNAISQILIGMMFYHKIVNSSHGDLHQHNVLNHITEPGGYFHYKLYDKDYYIENIGYIWVIWDFGLSVPFDNSHQINIKREKELKTHIFKYLKNRPETSDLTTYLGAKLDKYDYLYDENNKKHLISRNNILFDLKFFCNINDDFCIYNYYIKYGITNFKFINDLLNTINTDVVYKCLKLNLTSYDLPVMQKLLIEWMVKMNLLLTEIPDKSKIINIDNPYIL